MMSSSSSRLELHLARLPFAFSVLVCATLAARLVRELPLLGACLAGLAGGAVAWAIVTRRFRAARRVEIFLTVAVLNLLLVAPELYLRARGFRYESGVLSTIPGSTSFQRFVRDDRLLWTLDPLQPGVNSLGFPGEEIAEPKPPNVKRVLFLGDSCTQQGYPEIVERRLRKKLKGARADVAVETVNAAISGFSSVQGRLVAEHFGARFEPDAVVVYFGWNDHWLARGVSDEARASASDPGTLARAYDAVYGRVRVLQWLNKRFGAKPPADTGRTYRVSPEEYRANLLRIAEIFRERGVPVVFVTAPTSFYRLGPPEFLERLGFVPTRKDAAILHRRYNSIVREVAQTTGSRLLDLEQSFEALPDHRQREIFLTDGIHFRKKGLHEVAERVSPVVREVLFGRTTPP